MAYNGSGILLLERYRNKDYLVLFRDSWRPVLSSLGGLMDPGEKPSETAARESREESGNFLKLLPKEIVERGKTVVVKTYLCYIIYVTGLHDKDFRRNMKLVHKRCRDGHWKEISAMTRIPIKNLDTVEHKERRVIDRHGKDWKVRRRTISLIQKSLELINEVLQQPPIRLKRFRTKHTKMKCLRGTISYQIRDDEKGQIKNKDKDKQKS